MKQRILFVDDEPNVLQGLQRMLHGMRAEWSPAFANSGMEALELMEREEFDVIVSDIRMPQMDGITLLTQVAEKYPHMMRIVLSGQSKQEHILPSVGLAHQYLSKPSSCEEIKYTIERVASLRNLLADPKLKGLVAKVGTLPSLPSIHTELVNELQSETCSVNSIGEIVSKDVGMTAKLLQLVNSSFFGLPHRVSTAMQAVQFLGIETVRALMISYHAFAGYEKNLPPEFSLPGLWRHSLATAAIARRIAAGESKDVHKFNDAWTAGLLHDVGKMILASALPKQYKTVMQLASIHKMPIQSAETGVLGASHAEVGACLLSLWGLPDTIVEAVAYHHRPNECVNQEFSALSAVYAANIIERGDANALSQAAADPYLVQVGLAEKMSFYADQQQEAASAAPVPEAA